MPDQIITDAGAEFKKILEHLKEENAGLRVGRANPAMVENIQVDQYGSMTTIKAVASITVPEPTQILISPWDKNICGEIEKAIAESPLGLTPQNDGQQIRVTLPQMTEERRAEVAKMAHKFAENARVKIRTVREDARKDIEKKGEDETLSEDLVRNMKEELQKEVDGANKEIDETAKVKGEEIMSL